MSSILRQLPRGLALMLPWAVSGCVAATAGVGAGYRANSGERHTSSSAYQIRIGGEGLGRVRVWSMGVVQSSDDDADLLDVHLRIRNESDAPMALNVDETDLEVVTPDGRVHPVDAPELVSGGTTVAPGKVGKIGLRFVLPEGVEPDEIEGFDLEWTLDTGRGPYEEVTSFAVQEPRAHAAVFWPAYAPWWWDVAYPWGWWYPGYVGFGVGVGAGSYYGGHHRGPHGGGFHGGGYHGGGHHGGPRR